MPKPTNAPASATKKQVSRANVPVRTNGQDSIVWTAWNAWKRGDRILLLQIWDFYDINALPPDLHDIMREILEQTSMPSPAVTKRTPGRPKLTTRLHTEVERDEIARSVEWLLKIKPGMSKKHARHLTAQWLNLDDRSERLIKQYCLDFARKHR